MGAAFLSLPSQGRVRVGSLPEIEALGLRLCANARMGKAEQPAHHDQRRKRPDREGKVTLPVTIAIAAANDEERAFWTRVIADKDQKDGDFEHALDLISKHGALQATLEAARTHAANAREALSGFPDNVWKTALTDLADFVVERAH